VYRQERSHFHRRCAGTPTKQKAAPTAVYHGCELRRK